eukprot:359423-Chlamydomonas_euryale.AAC.3
MRLPRACPPACVSLMHVRLHASCRCMLQSAALTAFTHHLRVAHARGHNELPAKEHKQAAHGRAKRNCDAQRARQRRLRRVGIAAAQLAAQHRHRRDLDAGEHILRKHCMRACRRGGKTRGGGIGYGGK